MGKKKIVGVCGGDPRTDYIKLSLEKKGYEICDGFSDPLFYQKAEQCDAVLSEIKLEVDLLIFLKINVCPGLCHASNILRHRKFHFRQL